MKDKKSLCIAIIFLLVGIIMGFFIAPIKQGFGNNSGNNNNYYGDKKDENVEKDNE